MPKTKIPQHGAFNNSTKKKYCSTCSTWVHSSQWKKHQDVHNADLAEAQQGWTPREKTSEEQILENLLSDFKKLLTENSTLSKELTQLRQVAFIVGRLITILYEY